MEFLSEAAILLRMIRAKSRILAFSLIMAFVSSILTTAITTALGPDGYANFEHMAHSEIADQDMSHHHANHTSHESNHATFLANDAEADGHSGHAHGGDCQLVCCPHSLSDYPTACPSTAERGQRHKVGANTLFASEALSGPYRPPQIS
ncbi:MAG: hypothetical protein AAFN79_11985 [Pseudomonadota bacterium]